MPHLPATQRSPLSQSITRALFAGLLATSPLLVIDTALAQTASTEQNRSYAIPAGNLDQTLNRFASEAGILLSVNSRLTTGKQSAGLNGSYSVDAGLTQLLVGTGLRALKAGENYALEVVVESGDSLELEATNVTGTHSSIASEGTGSYVAPGPIGAATPLGLTLRETPQSVSVVTKQRMEDQGLTTIGDVMAQVPGVTQYSLGSERAGFTSRGYAISNYQLDGISTNAFGEGLSPQVAQSTADMAVYDRIEVLRGSSGLMSGAGDPSGTINMIRKKPTTQFQGSVEGGVGSWGEKRSMLDLSGSLIESNKLRGRAVAAWQDGDSFIDHYGLEKKVFYGVLEADLTDSTLLTAGVEHQRRESHGSLAFLGFPLWYSDGSRTDLSRSFSPASRDNSYDSKSTTVFASLEQALAHDWKLKISANHLSSSQREDVIYLDVSAGFANSQTGDGLSLSADRRDHRVRLDSVDVNVQGPITLFGAQHDIVLGADYQDVTNYTIGSFDQGGLNYSAANLYTWDRRGVGQYGDALVRFDNPMRQSSVYAAGRFTLSEQLKLILGTKVFRYSSNAVTNNPTYNYYSAKPASENNLWTPYGGLVYDINETHTAYLSYATIYKPQTAQDRNGQLIDPREGATLETGIKSEWLGGDLSTAVALYQIRQDNLTETDPGYTIPGTNNAASRAIKGAKTQGLDVEVTGAMSSDWNVSASWTYGQSKNAEGERITTTFPRHLVKLWTTYRLPGDWNRLTVGGGANWQSKTYSTVDTWQVSRSLYWEQKPYTVVNLMTRYDISDDLSATLNVDNLFDKKYITSVSDWWFSGYYGAPRNVMASLKYSF
ncbi:TonB-dependent siderophore receptor [Pseudomonas sp. 5P_5.1_Bac1]|uniref:TonB-dependent siderophore receptor n=1 Tax=Pseudomonas sp. 5P_5.1_Bac1 TaxID=2971616 RepID=UPI0021C98F11|nr:TonB-dependent receptor [Pseudomonas sp. 5P_5.1_Bac1]MCU1720926.1 TonB-dependent receptor [Pseudomonas sp. 5P_5.1_Bac1]